MSDQQIIINARDFSIKHMSQYDGSHDYSHVCRVVNMALYLAKHDKRNINIVAVEVAALMHDVNDHKYTHNDSKTIYEHVINFGAGHELATLVDTIVTHVSYTYEIKNQHLDVYKTIMLIPECQIVQDADRLDALGAAGIARTFMYNGIMNRSIEDCFDHFHYKLYNIESMMKTPLGTKLAGARTQLLKTFLRCYRRDENYAT